MSNWRKIGLSIFDIDLISYFDIGRYDDYLNQKPELKNKYIIKFEQKNEKNGAFTEVNFETQQEAMEYLIKALREDICP